MVSLFKRISIIKKKTKINIEIVYVNDASTDNTINIIKKIHKPRSFKFVNNSKNLGFGGSFIKGLKYANGEYIMIFPGEDVYTTKSLIKFIKFGVKNRATMSIYSNKEFRHPLRRLITFLIAKLCNLIFKKNVKQYTGPFIYKRKDLNNLKIWSKKFAFQIEILIKLLNKTIPLNYEYLTIKKKSGFFSSAISLDSFKDLLKTISKL